MHLNIAKIRGRWQGDYSLRPGHLATLKGVGMKNKKLNSLVERELYSRYKTAPTEEEKEKYRQEYLDRRGIPKDFRW